MVEAYRVSARLALSSDAAKVLRNISEALGVLDGKIAATEKDLNKALGRLTGFTDKINEAVRSLVDMRTAANAAVAGMNRVGEAAHGHTAAMGDFARAATRAAKAAADVQRAASGANGRSPGTSLVLAQRLLGGPASEPQGALVPSPRLLTGPSSGGGGALVHSPLLLPGYGTSGGALVAAMMAGGLARRGGGFGSGGGGGGGAGGGGRGMVPWGPNNWTNGNWNAGIAGMFNAGMRGGPPGGSPPGGGGGGRRGPQASRMEQVAAAGATGYGLLNFARSATMAAGALQHQQTMLSANVLNQNEVTEATKRSWEVTRLVRGTSVTENFKAINELRSVLGSTEEAMAFLPKFQRFSVMLGSVTGKPAENAGYQAARALELRGALSDPKTGHMDQARFEREMGFMESVVRVTGGRVGPNDMLNFMQQAGPSARLLTPEALYEHMLAAIQAMGGHRAGTADAAITRQLLGGVMTQRTVKGLEDIGVLDKKKVTTGKGGQITLAPNAITNQKMIGTDPFQWVMTTLMPALTAKGFVTDEQKMEQLFRLFGTETARRIMAEFIQARSQIERDARLVREAGASGGQKTIETKDFDVAMKNLHTAWTNFQTALGTATLPMVIGTINKMADGLNYLAGVLVAHPDAAQNLLLLTTALGGLLAGAAVWMVGSTALSALGALGGGIAALGVAVGGPVAWGLILATLAGGLINLAASMSGKDWKGLFDSIASSMDGFWSRVGKMLGIVDGSGAMPGVPGAAPPGGLPTPPPIASPMGDLFGSNFQPVPPGRGDVVVQTALNLDGRTVADVVTRHQGRALNAPVQGPSFADPRRGFLGGEVATA